MSLKYPDTERQDAEAAYCCDACARPIKIDTLVDNDLWREISPTKNEAGLLCASCIADRITEVRGGKTWAALRIISAHL